MTSLMEVVPSSAICTLPTDAVRAIAYATARCSTNQTIDSALVDAVCATSDRVAARTLLEGLILDRSGFTLGKVLATLAVESSPAWASSEPTTATHETVRRLLSVIVGSCAAADPWTSTVPTTWVEVFDILETPTDHTTFEDAVKVSALSSLVGFPLKPAVAPADWSERRAQEFLGNARLLLDRCCLEDFAVLRGAYLSLSATDVYLRPLSSEAEQLVLQLAASQWASFFSLWPCGDHTVAQVAGAVLAT